MEVGAVPETTAKKVAVAESCGEPNAGCPKKENTTICNGYPDDKELKCSSEAVKANGLADESLNNTNHAPKGTLVWEKEHSSKVSIIADSVTKQVEEAIGAKRAPEPQPEVIQDVSGQEEQMPKPMTSNSSEDSQSAEDEKSETSKRTPCRTSERNRQRVKSQEGAKEVVPPPPQEEVPPREKLPPVDRPINWIEGDLVWSLVSGHPLWPCMVTADPVSGSHTRLKGSAFSSSRAYHVQFFGNSPEHAWVNGSRINKFLGKDDYESLVREMAKCKQKRPPKIEISKRFLENWNAAIDEIAVALPMSKDERMKKFTFVYVKNIPQKIPQEEAQADSVEAAITTMNAVVEIKPVDEKVVEKAKDQKVSGKMSQKDKTPKEPKRSQTPRSRKIETAKSRDNDVKRKKLEKRDASPEKKASNKKLKDAVEGRVTPAGDRRKSTTNGKVSSRSKAKADGVTTPYECMHCPDIYFSVDEMRDHCKLKHPDLEAWKNKNHVLETGGSGLVSEVLLLSSSTSLPLEASAPSDYTSLHNCPICGQGFANKRSLGQHRRFSHPGNANHIVAAEVIPLSSSLPADDSSGTDNSIASNQLRPKNEPAASGSRPKPRLQVISQARKEPICAVCEKNGDVLLCTSDCYRSFHAACLGDYNVSDPFVCKECKTETHACIICGKSGADWLGKLKRCVVPLCGRYFHGTCLQIHTLKCLPDGAEKQFGIPNNNRCPSHSCATCLSKALVDAQKKGGSVRSKSYPKSRLFKCIRCPTAYHVGDDCIAAGSVILGGLHIVCPSHFNPVKSLPHHHPVHISWCFVCSKGGELICCATCPAAFHARCIDLDKTPEGDWHCLDCSCGVRPLYDDIIWVKLGTYRWWPGQVTHPSEVPDNIARLQHGPGEFVVRFFGSNDYFWLSKYRVFLYQEGDNGATNRHCSRGISGVFKKALQEAEEKFADVSTRRQLQEEVKTAENDKKPAPYRHIKCNKPVGRVQIYMANLRELAKCVCKRNDLHPCGQESECLNRMLMYECHPTVCPAGDRCENQRFQKCEYPETEIFKTEWGGWGLKSKVFVKKGSFVNEYVGELVDEEECRLRIEKSHENSVTNFYMLTIDKDRIIDAGPKGNFSRFMNHCCDPNCETQKWMVNGDTRVGLFAVRDIMPGEELTFNYNLDCLGNDKTKCMCGSDNCSGFIGVRPKPQSGQGVKKEIKKRRKQRRAEPIPQHDDFCFRCRQTGTLVCCDYKGCLRAFCLDCLHIQKPPYGKWECPCHHCDWCGRRAQYFCSFCPNSFCGSHVQNQLHSSVPNAFDTCLDHSPETAEFEMAETVATVNELMNASQEGETVNSGAPQLNQQMVLPSQSAALATGNAAAPKKGAGPVDAELQNGISGDGKRAGTQKRKREPVARKVDKKVKKAESL